MTRTKLLAYSVIAVVLLEVLAAYATRLVHVAFFWFAIPELVIYGTIGFVAARAKVGFGFAVIVLLLAAASDAFAGTAFATRILPTSTKSPPSIESLASFMAFIMSLFTGLFGFWYARRNMMFRSSTTLSYGRNPTEKRRE